MTFSESVAVISISWVPWDITSLPSIVVSLKSLSYGFYPRLTTNDCFIQFPFAPLSIRARSVYIAPVASFIWIGITIRILSSILPVLLSMLNIRCLLRF